MAIFRCKSCAHLQEQPDGQIGVSISCPKCGVSAPVYNTTFFIAKVLEKYFEARREIASLKATDKTGAPTTTSLESMGLDQIDLSDTDKLATELQHEPIHDWFSRRQMRINVNLRGVDTTGFFDEVALSIGRNLPLLEEVLERIRWAQHKEFASTTIHFEKKSAQDARDISAFCQLLYDFSFVAKCIHNRHEQNIRLVLQTAPAIRRFFDGEWMEWYALMICLQYAKERKKSFSCARNLKITLQSGESYELDVFMLIDTKLPICIECKTGEFRQNIDKYLTLRKHLGINGKSFIMCVADLSGEQAKGLTAMYDLTFTNERELSTKLAQLF